MRNLSIPLRSALFKKHTTEGIIPLLKVSWTDDPILGTDEIRLADNTTNITSNGELYTRSAFDVTLPKQDPDDIGILTLLAGNVDQSLVASIRQLTVETIVVFSVVTLLTAGDHDTVEFSLSGPWETTDYDKETIQIRVQVFKNIAIEPFPAHRYRFSDGFNILR